jgi:outer membrane lipoprotein-sorting protein
VRVRALRKPIEYSTKIALGLLLGCMLASAGTAQNPENLMPEESAAKGKQILNSLINGFGGPAYLEVRESDCEGRRASFGHNGELTGYTRFKVYWRYPDKNRTDYSKKGVIIDLYNGDKGWTLDRGGVTEQSTVAVADFQEQTKRDVNNLLRTRLNEPGLVIRYGGTDIVDLKTVDWVDITDSEQRNFRLAVDRTTRWLTRSVVSVEDPETHQRNSETYIYTNYQLMDSVWTPMQITLDRNGRRISQFFFQTCKFNPHLPDEIFTRAALDKRFSEVGSRKYKAEKKKEKEEDN